MRILNRNVYVGPSQYAKFPVIRLELDLGALEQWPTARLGDVFIDGLVAALPGLAEHGCSYREPAGFILGEGLGDSIFALHFAKGLTKFKGIYQFMYNHFAGIMSDRYELLNFEQDLGNPELRHAKSSYRPDRMIHKYRVSLKGASKN